MTAIDARPIPRPLLLLFRQTVGAFRRVKEKHLPEAERMVGVMATWAASAPTYAAAARELHAELSRDPYWATHLSSLKELERPAWEKRAHAGGNQLVRPCRGAARAPCQCLSRLLTD